MFVNTLLIKKKFQVWGKLRKKNGICPWFSQKYSLSKRFTVLDKKRNKRAGAAFLGSFGNQVRLTRR